MVSPYFNRSNMPVNNEKLYNGDINKSSKDITLNLEVKDTVKPNKVQRKKIKLKVSPEKRSPVPKLGAKKKSPVPLLGSRNGSPGPKLGTRKSSPETETEIQPTNSDSGNKIADSLQSKMVNSPSLRPVNVKNLISNFENNFKTDLDGTKKDKISDAFETLMKSKGDTPAKTPTRKKPKRLKSVKTPGTAGSVMDRWLRKF